MGGESSGDLPGGYVGRSESASKKLQLGDEEVLRGNGGLSDRECVLKWVADREKIMKDRTVIGRHRI